MKNLKIGIIGCGHITQQMHLPVLNALQQSELSWVYDTNPNNAKLVSKTYHVEVLSTLNDISAILAQTDIILLAVPIGVRQEYLDLIECANSKPALFIEKPFARTLDEHDSIAAILPSHKLCCNYWRRFDANVQLVREIIQDKTFGELEKLEFCIASLGGLSVGDGYYSNPQLAGGGFLLEIGVHYMDALLYVSGTKPVGQAKGRMVFDHGFDLHSELECKVETEDGRSIPFCYTVSSLVEKGNFLSIAFETHIIKFSLFSNEPIELRKIRSDHSFQLTARGADSTSSVSVARFWLEFIAGIQSGRENSTSVANSRGVTSLIEASYKLKDHEVVDLA